MCDNLLVPEVIEMTCFYNSALERQRHISLVVCLWWGYLLSLGLFCPSCFFFFSFNRCGVEAARDRRANLCILVFGLLELKKIYMHA